MNEAEKQKQNDAVTCGQIRKRYEEILEIEIEHLVSLIKKGDRAEAEQYLNQTIGLTLTKLDNIKTEAGLINLFKD